MKKSLLLIISILFLTLFLTGAASATLIDSGDGLTAAFYDHGQSVLSGSLQTGGSWTGLYRNTVTATENQLLFTFEKTPLSGIALPNSYSTFGIQVGDIDGSFHGYYIDTNIEGVNYSFANGVFAIDLAGTTINTDSYLTATMHNPIPAPILLLGTGLIGMAGFRKRLKK